MDEKKNTVIFLDEIQAYPHLLTMFKFLKQDDRCSSREETESGGQKAA